MATTSAQLSDHHSTFDGDQEQGPLVLDRILGAATDPEHAPALHDLAHRGQVETVLIDPSEIARRRFRTRTDQGTDCAVALARSDRLFNGAVLLITPDRAIIVKVRAEEILRLIPTDQAAALELGFHAGNLHWRVRFENGALLVLMDGPRDTYVARLQTLLDDGKVVINDHK